MKEFATIGLGIILIVAVLAMGIFVPNHFSNAFLNAQYEYEQSLSRLFAEKAPAREVALLKENFKEYRFSLKGLVNRFLDLKSLIIVIGGSFASSLIAHRGRVAFGGLKQLFKIFGGEVNNREYEETYRRLLEFAQTKQDGEPIPDEAIQDIPDEHFRNWMFDFIAVDMVSEESMRAILDSEVEKYEYGQYKELEILEHYTKSLPAFGMIGTVVGLILMLGEVTESSANLIDLMGSMSIALITTLYGVVMTYSLFSPALTKRKLRIDAKAQQLRMVRSGIFDIYAGENLEIMKKNLMGFMPAAVKVKLMRESAGSESGGLGL